MANIHDFIDNSLDLKYQTQVGEKVFDYLVVNVKELE